MGGQVAKHWAVADYLNGKEPALCFLMDQAMKASRGKANPNLVMDLLKARLAAWRSDLCP